MYRIHLFASASIEILAQSEDEICEIVQTAKRLPETQFNIYLEDNRNLSIYNHDFLGINCSEAQNSRKSVPLMLPCLLIGWSIKLM